MPAEYQSSHRNALKPWSNSEVARVLSMMIDGRDPHFISVKLGRSEKAIKQKLQELEEEGHLDSVPAAIAYVEELQRAATVKCLRCQTSFQSFDKRKNRICQRCKEYIGNE